MCNKCALITVVSRQTPTIPGTLAEALLCLNKGRMRLVCQIPVTTTTCSAPNLILDFCPAFAFRIGTHELSEIQAVGRLRQEGLMVEATRLHRDYIWLHRDSVTKQKNGPSCVLWGGGGPWLKRYLGLMVGPALALEELSSTLVLSVIWPGYLLV